MNEQQRQRLVQLHTARFYRYLLADNARWVDELARLDRAWDKLIAMWH